MKRALTVGVDARILGRRGVGRYLASLLQTLAPKAGDTTLVLFTGSKSDRTQIPKSKNVRELRLPERHPAVLEQWVIPNLARREGCDLLHFPDNTSALWPGIPMVVTLHDTMWLRPLSEAVARPTFSQRMQDRYRKFVCPRGAKAATAVITISTHSKQSIREHLGPVSEKTVVIGQGVGPAMVKALAAPRANRIRKKLGVRRPYFLASAAADRRKNIDRLLAAFAALRKRPGFSKHQLVLTSLREGEWGTTTGSWTARAVGLSGAKAGGKDDALRLLGYVGDDELKALYQGAAAFVFPSLWEGFGLPLLEAFNLGCPVVTSNRGALPEVAGKAALVADPLDARAISLAMEKACKPAQARRLRAAGKKQCRRFSWEKAAEATLNLYRKAAAKS